MKKLQANAKIIQKMHRGGAIEVNKATGSEKNISQRESEKSHDFPEIGTLADRISTERKAIKKRALKKAVRKMQLKFEGETDIKNSTMTRPMREAALAIRNEVRKSDNVGTDTAQFYERTVSAAVRLTGRASMNKKLHQQRAMLRAELKADKSAVKLLYRQSLRENPKLRTANPIRKVLHKRRIKRDYIKSLRSGTVKQTKTAMQSKRIATGMTRRIAHGLRYGIGKKFAVAVIIIILLTALLITAASSCMTLISGGLNTILMTSYTAEDEDILGADEDYFAMATELAERIEQIESDNPGYDEYRYYLDVIGHDPFVLASYLTARFNMYTRAEVQAELAELFALQYELTLESVVELRTRTEIHTEIIIETDPDTGEETQVEVEIEVEVEYEYRILEVTLRNRSLDMIVIPRMTPDELEMFRILLETQGNRPELFADHPHADRREYLRYEIPPEALADEQFARMIAEAEKFLGWPYVWGGSSPATSFDCSGYVSWVINNTGWNVGRLGARSLFNICIPVSPSEARPGDLIFFNHTYAAPQPHLPTHVGIYVGQNMMIHCGNPISYADITTPYWTRHFYAFGRLPDPLY